MPMGAYEGDALYNEAGKVSGELRIIENQEKKNGNYEYLPDP